MHLHAGGFGAGLACIFMKLAVEQAWPVPISNMSESKPGMYLRAACFGGCHACTCMKQALE